MGAWSQIQQIVSNFTLFQLTLDTQVTLGVFTIFTKDFERWEAFEANLPVWQK